MHVVVNAAVSADGKLSTRRREQVAISGPADFDRVDELRAASDAVMVGVGTVLADDPHLTLDDPDRVDAREERGEPPHPARVVVDTRARTPLDARVFDDAATTYLLAGAVALDDRLAAVEERGVEVIRAGAGRVALRAALSKLESRGVDRLLVEGGGELVSSLFALGLVDELSLYVGSLVIGGQDAPTVADSEGFVDREAFPDLDLESVERIDDGVLLRYSVV
jgi:2,5-diamino-6-(ribosylamino)-4(3H)-pyrimidinone 5'-phosphate reductase